MEDGMENDDIDRLRLNLEEKRLELEKKRFEHESKSSRNYVVPLFGVLTAVVAGLFALGPVGVAYFQKEKELNQSSFERDRHWKLEMVDFIFKNKDIIFSKSGGEDQQRIIRVMLVAFPPEISGPIFEKVKADAPPEQRPQWENAQLQLESNQQQQSSKPSGVKYYVIAMTSSDCGDIDKEIARVKQLSPNTFSGTFPNVTHYAPPDGACTLLVSDKSLPYIEAVKLRDKAKAAGFSRETWLWQNTVWYFSVKENAG